MTAQGFNDVGRGGVAAVVAPLDAVEVKVLAVATYPVATRQEVQVSALVCTLVLACVAVSLSWMMRIMAIRAVPACTVARSESKLRNTRRMNL